MARAITKTAYAAGRSCPLRGYRSLVRNEWGNAPPPAPSGGLARYRMRDAAVTALHRIWLRGGQLDLEQLPALAQSCWESSGGEGLVDPTATDWLREYVSVNPFMTNRRLVAVQQTFTNTFMGRCFSARPDALCVEGDTLLALELTSARAPLLDRRAITVMAAIDQLALHGPDLPERYRRLDLRVLVCSHESGHAHDVTLSRAEAAAVLTEMVEWVAQLAVARAAGALKALPSRDGCGRCQYRRDCPSAFPPADVTGSVPAPYSWDGGRPDAEDPRERAEGSSARFDPPLREEAPSP